MTRSRWRAAVGATVAAAGLLVAPAGADAQSDFTWTGGGGASAWSDPVNWASQTAPSGSVGTLSFPQLVSACISNTPNTCYRSTNDIPGLNVDGLVVDPASQYFLSGDAITLGAKGISSDSTAPGGPDYFVVDLPITLGADQSWSNSQPNTAIEIYSDATGAHRLQIEPEAGSVALTGADEVGPVSVTGGPNCTQPPGALVLSGALNTTDGQPVTVTGSELWIAAQQPGHQGPPSASIGPLTLHCAELNVGAPLSVAGPITLDGASSSVLAFNPNGPGPQPLIAASGDVALAGSLQLSSTTELQVGDVATLLQTTGAITGTFAGVPNGAIAYFANSSAESQPAPAARINYTAHSVTATYLGPGDSSTSLSADPSAPVVNQPVTLTATVSSGGATPAGTVAFNSLSGPFNLLSEPIAGCAAVPVVLVSGDGAAACHTAFATATGQGGWELGALFTPSNPSVLCCSGDQIAIDVGPAASTETVAASRTWPAPGVRVTYTATVTPQYAGPAQPAGTVDFTDGSTTLRACGAAPVTVTGSTARATCTVSYTTAGRHTTTASFLGDADFTATVARATIRVRPVSAQTGRASGLRRHSARLHGVVDTGGAAVTWRFVYGRGRFTNRLTRVRRISAGRGNVPVSVTVGHLAAATRYHVRLVVTMAGGRGVRRHTSRGRDLTLQTTGR